MGASEVQWLGIYHGKYGVHKKKNFKGFPMFLHLKFFKTALTSDLRQWPSRRYRRRHLYCRRHRLRKSKVERKMNNVEGYCYSW
jgi:hypothetical protein